MKEITKFPNRAGAFLRNRGKWGAGFRGVCSIWSSGCGRSAGCVWIAGCLWMACNCWVACSRAPVEVKVSSFNIWLNTLGGKLPPAQTAKVIESSLTDIVGIQEGHIYEENGVRHDHVPEIAAALGFRLFNQGEGHYILSRYPFADSLPSRRGVKIEVPGGRHVWMFNCHLNYIPYQPYQLNGIPYGEYPFIETEAEAVRFASEARIDEVARFGREIAQVMKEGCPVFLTGDFNEPSCLDWTERAAAAGLHKLKVAWPATRAFGEIGLKDSYRTVHPDEVATPGYTWTPVPSEREVFDRLDFVFYAGCEPTGSFLTGESEATSDVVVSPYPSDHRMVTSGFRW